MTPEDLKHVLVNALYVPAPQRHDCCLRCRHSELQDGKELRCKQHHGAVVTAFGICAVWTPNHRRVPAEGAAVSKEQGRA